MGFIWKTLTPYAHCSEPLTIHHYRIAVLMPLVILGIIPTFYSLITGNFFVLLYGLFLSNAAIGDIIIFILTLDKGKDLKVIDHPSECGFIIID